jgi:hypothetical protein
MAAASMANQAISGIEGQGAGGVMAIVVGARSPASFDQANTVPPRLSAYHRHCDDLNTLPVLP